MRSQSNPIGDSSSEVVNRRPSLRLFLSSSDLGDDPSKLPELYGANKRVGVILNSRDYSKDEDRREAMKQEWFSLLDGVGLLPEELDLREYFGNKRKLKERLGNLGGVWVKGGSVFVLAMSFKLSGFDDLLREFSLGGHDFVYAGSSAAGCVMQKSLKGIEISDDPGKVNLAYDCDPIWEGVGLIDYVFVPHYQEDHHHFAETQAEVDFYRSNKIAYQTLRDGEVIIVDTGRA